MQSQLSDKLVFLLFLDEPHALADAVRAFYCSHPDEGCKARLIRRVRHKAASSVDWLIQSFQPKPAFVHVEILFVDACLRQCDFTAPTFHTTSKKDSHLLFTNTIGDFARWVKWVRTKRLPYHQIRICMVRITQIEQKTCAECE
jgi:hypothetical protein